MDSISRARPRRTGGFLVAAALAVGTLMPGQGAAVGDRGADGDFERRDSFHFTLHQDVDIDESGGLYGSRRFEQQLLAELEGAFTTLDRLLGMRPDKKIVVYVWDPALFDREYAGLFRFPAAGFYGGAIHIRGATQIGPRLVRVLHHELLHAALDAEAPRVVFPAWMNEGMAEWFEARAAGKRGLSAREAAVLRQVAQSGGLFPLEQLSARSLGGFGPEAASLAYLQSYGFIDFLVRTRGERDLARFWKAVARSGSLERAARRVYRSDLALLEGDFHRAFLGR